MALISVICLNGYYYSWLYKDYYYQVGANTVGDVKKVISSKKAKYRDVNRQELRLEPKGKALKDDQTLSSLGLNTGALLYFKVVLFHFRYYYCLI